jgi:hypothetical protein
MNIIKSFILGVSLLLATATFTNAAGGCVNTKEHVMLDGKQHGAEVTLDTTLSDREVIAKDLRKNSEVAAESVLSASDLFYAKIAKYPTVVFVAIFHEGCMSNFGTISIDDYRAIETLLKGV